MLVLPGAPLVTTGPYALIRHPNYVAVVGELVGMALTMGAARHRPVATLFFLGSFAAASWPKNGRWGPLRAGIPASVDRR